MTREEALNIWLPAIRSEIDVPLFESQKEKR